MMGPQKGGAAVGTTNKKPRGKMTPYACFVKVIRAEHKKKHPNEHIVFAEFSKKCAEKWAQMKDKEKKRFQELSEKDRERYDLEMQTYIPPPGGDGKPMKGGKKKQKKDPNAPKRALCGFMFFCNEQRPVVKAANPDMKIGEIAKVLGEQWKTCARKPHFENLAVKDKERYDAEMKVYRAGGKVSSARAAPVAEVVESDESMSGSEEDDE